MLKQVLVLLNQLLGSEPIVLIEQIHSHEVVVEVVEDFADQYGVDEGEKVPSVSESYIAGEGIVVIGVETEVCENTAPIKEIACIVDYWVGHDVVPLRVVGVKVKSSCGESRVQFGGSDDEVHDLLHTFIPPESGILIGREVASSGPH